MMLSVFRKEIKYVMHSHEFAAMRQTLQSLMYKDTHGGDFGYTVRSLYFDSVYDRDYYDTVDGLQKKSKIRLRIYDGRDDVIKLELKTKDGSESKKWSLNLTRSEADRMQQGDYDFLLSRPEEIAQRIWLKMTTGAYLPKTLLEYDREAYIYPVGDTRVTFDSRVRATASAWDLFDPDPPYTPVVPPGTGVLEVKFNAMLPSFIKAAVESGRLPSANSKYNQAREFYQIGGNG